MDKLIWHKYPSVETHNQWIGFKHFHYWGLDSIPGWGTKIPQEALSSQKEKQNRRLACRQTGIKPGISLELESQL